MIGDRGGEASAELDVGLELLATSFSSLRLLWEAIAMAGGFEKFRTVSRHCHCLLTVYSALKELGQLMVVLLNCTK